MELPRALSLREIKRRAKLSIISVNLFDLLAVESRPASPSSPNTNMAGSTTNESRENSALNINIQEINLAEWQLTINDEKNDEIRSDFYFDQVFQYQRVFS